MRKLLALLLTLAMVLSLASVAVVATEEPADLTAGAAVGSEVTIDGVKYEVIGDTLPTTAGNYIMSKDIHIGTTLILEEGEDAKSFTVEDNKIVANDVVQNADEADLITLPAGLVLHGNNKVIYQDYFVKNPVDHINSSSQQGAGTHSMPWNHAMFKLSAGNITIKNVKFGTAEQPIYLCRGGDGYSLKYTGPDTYSSYGLFEDVAGSNVTWENVEFNFDRQNGGLGNRNMGDVCYKLLGAHNFINCDRNGVVSAGSQHGGWFYTSAAGASLTMSECETNGVVSGSYIAGLIHSPSDTPIRLVNCTNNAAITSYYSSNGGFFSAFVGNLYGSESSTTATLYMEGCVNNGNVVSNNLTIGGAFIARTADKKAAKSVELVNCVNNGNVTTDGHTYSVTVTKTTAKPKGTTSKVFSNHGFGGLAGHIGAYSLIKFENCVNKGNVKCGANVGGIVGFTEGNATVTISGCLNAGNITNKGTLKYKTKTVDQTVNPATETWSNEQTVTEGFEVGGIGGQLRNANLTIDGCLNTGTITGHQAPAGILADAYLYSGITIKNTANYGAVNGATRAAGIVSVVYSAITLDHCVNYGAITSTQWSGGMVAENQAATTIKNSINYAPIKGVHGVGGFVGEVNGAAVTATNSVNAGDISVANTASEGVGGFVGRVKNAAYTVSFTKCVNLGKVTGSTKQNKTYGYFTQSFGQFIGRVNENTWLTNSYAQSVTFTLTDCYGLGSTALGKDGLKAESVLTAKDATVTATDPATIPNDGKWGINVKTVGGNAPTMLTDATENAAALNALKKADNKTPLFPVTFKADNGAVVVDEAPAVKGLQKSNDGKSVRIAATLNSLEGVNNVGFTYTVRVNGATVIDNKTATTNRVLYSVNETVAGQTNKVLAANNGGQYFYTLTFVNVPTNATVEITVQATLNGEAVGAVQTITLTPQA